MKRTFALLFMILVLVSASPVALIGNAKERNNQERDTNELADTPGLLWSDTRPSDTPLTGNDVVRRPSDDMLNFRSSAEFSKTWTLIIDGVQEASGVCGYSLEITEPVETATPKVFSMTAVDPSTCQFEFTVGIPTHPHMESIDGGESVIFETGSDAKTSRLNYAFPGLLLQVGDESKSQLRFTVYSEYKDPIQLVVNQVLSAVKAKVKKNGELQSYNCRHQRVWRTQTGWQDRSTGQWDDKKYDEANHSIKATTSGRFFNDSFILCDPFGYVWTYYDKLFARGASHGGSRSYTYGMSNHWYRRSSVFRPHSLGQLLDLSW